MTMRRMAGLVLACVAASVPAIAGDSVLGMLIVNGKATPLKSVAVAVQRDPDDAAAQWLVILVSDVPVAPADRTPSRLAALAVADKLRAVRVLWKEGYDTVIAAPYYPGLAGSGRLAPEHPTLDLERYDGTRFEGSVKSKMLGQDWFFQAEVKATIERSGVAEIERPLVVEAPPVHADERMRKKLALGRLGYEFTEESLRRAVSEGQVEAVRLFLDAGMSANTQVPSGEQPLATAVTTCAYGHEAQALEISKLLLAAGAKVDAGAKNGVTPLLSAAQYCQGVEIIEVLIEAGANVNTKAPGGATPLMFAKVFQRAAAEEALRKAGAHE
jgi:hypothetical protein